jgi:hypothetical protein
MCASRHRQQDLKDNSNIAPNQVEQKNVVCPCFPPVFLMADEAFDVLLETGVRIQPLPIWEDEWADPDHYANPRLLKNIAREGLRL